MHKLYLVLLIIVLGGCASTPEQRMAENAKTNDFDICWKLAMDSDYSYGEMKVELENEAKKRSLNCRLFTSQIIAARERQIKAGQMMYALGGALKGESPSLGPTANARVDVNSLYIQDYSGKTITGILSTYNDFAGVRNCIYIVDGKNMTRSVMEGESCPLFAEF